jgi:hypothetical protein
MLHGYSDPGRIHRYVEGDNKSLIKKNFNKSLGKGVNNRPWWAR